MSARTTRWLTALAVVCLHTTPWAQDLPPIYDKTPVHLAPTKVIAEYAKGTFLENIAANGAGHLLVNSHLD